MKPNRCIFEVGEYDGQTSLIIGDLDDSSNDDIREVDHPDFDKYWYNEMENTFSSDKLNQEEARKWCLSIGMVEATEPLINSYPYGHGD